MWLAEPVVLDKYGKSKSHEVSKVQKNEAQQRFHMHPPQSCFLQNNSLEYNFAD